MKPGIWARRELSSLLETLSSLLTQLLQESEGFAVVEIKAALPSRGCGNENAVGFTDTREMMMVHHLK